ncbi:MAG: DUF3147 domain-containing protein [Nitrospira sp.]|nr:DUF3147 domain-containing protein [Nitrospira sp.]
MPIKLILYFLVGGFVVSLVAYLGSAGRGLLSAFVATFPHITLVTLILIYLNGGVEHTLPYAKGLLLFAPAWLTYVGAFVLLLPRTGFWVALSGSLGVFLLVILATRILIR